MSEKYNFTAKIALKGVTGSYVKIRQRTWHRPSFNKMSDLMSQWENGQIKNTSTPISHITILNFIQFFHLSLYKSRANGVIDIQLGTQVEVDNIGNFKKKFHEFIQMIKFARIGFWTR